jgi:hypothetical protein
VAQTKIFAPLRFDWDLSPLASKLTLFFIDVLQYEPHSVEDILYLLFHSNPQEPCPNFVETTQFSWCSSLPSCSPQLHVWTYHTEDFWFICSGTYTTLESLTIWNATNAVWLETIIFGNHSVSACSSVPKENPTLNINPLNPIIDDCGSPSPAQAPIAVTWPDFIENPNDPPLSLPAPPSAPISHPSVVPTCSNCSPRSSTTPQPINMTPTKLAETPQGQNRRAKTVGVVIGSIFGALLLVGIVAGVIYGVIRNRGRYIEGPIEHHRFQNNPLYISNKTEHFNPLYRPDASI